MANLVFISGDYANPEQFESADWDVEDPGTGGDLNLILNRIPATGTYPLARVTYNAGSPTDPTSNPEEVIVSDAVLSDVLNGTTPLPATFPFPFAVPNDVSIGVVIRLVDSEGNAGALSEVKEARATDATGGTSAATEITLTSTSVNENAGIGTTIGFISANATPTATYSKAADPDGKFRVEDNRLVLDGVVDRSASSSHSVTLRATNVAGTYEETFTISVTASSGVAVYESEIGPAAQVANVQNYGTYSGAVTVSNQSQLNAAQSSASAGSVIVLADGYYGDDLYITASGSSGNPVLIVAKNYLGAQCKRLWVQARNVTVQGIECTGRMQVGERGQNPGTPWRNVTLQNMKMKGFQCRYWENLQWLNNIVDGGFSLDGQMYFGEGFTARNSIYCREGGDDMVKLNDVCDMDWERCIFFDQRVPDTSTKHSDLVQCFGPRMSGTQKWRFHKCLFWIADVPNIQRVQGLFLSDGEYRGVDVQQCLLGRPTSPSRIGPVIQRGTGEVRYCSTWGDVSSDKSGTNSGMSVRDNIAKGYNESGNGPPGTLSGNVFFGTNPGPGAYFDDSPSHGFNPGYDWRDFLNSSTKGARGFLDELVGEWGG